jgi:hypothetical protein
MDTIFVVIQFGTIFIHVHTNNRKYDNIETTPLLASPKNRTDMKYTPYPGLSKEAGSR